MILNSIHKRFSDLLKTIKPKKKNITLATAILKVRLKKRLFYKPIAESSNLTTYEVQRNMQLKKVKLIVVKIGSLNNNTGLKIFFQEETIFRIATPKASKSG